jgi:NAD(P)-dependent dehydrogenase (short-subunit alcohol dehydrogenase family)
MTSNGSDFVVVTGVSSGIGFATATELIEHGFHVFGSVRRKEDADRVSAELGKGFTPLLMDVTDVQSVRNAAETIADPIGEQGLAGLVNNAGIAVGGPLMHMPLDDLRRHCGVNVVGVMAVTQAFLPMLGGQQEAPQPPGRIVNISSVSAHTVYPFVGPYAASKHALEALSHALRRELMLYGIDVILVVAGAVATPIWEKMGDEEAAIFAETDFSEAGNETRKTAASLGREGMPASRVASAIRKALTDPKPKASYLLSNNWLMGWYLPRKIPTRMLDRLIARRLGLLP